MRAPLLMAVLTALVIAASPSRAQEGTADHEARNEWTAGVGRTEIESLELHLEHAVSRVSIPHAGILLGRASASRGYRLPGYGVLFVLTPRALPGERPVFVVKRQGPRGEAEVHIEHHVTRAGEGQHWVPERIEELERRVLILQHTAEAQRRAAEEDMDRIVEDVRLRVEVEKHGDRPSEARDVTVRVDTPGTEPPPDAVFVQEMPGPPWKNWFEGQASKEERTADRVVEDVRAAVITALESRAAVVVGLGEEEFVAVAVDFVPGDFFASHRRPTRTLIVRARQRDLEARAQGTIALEELRARVEVIEY